MMEPEKNIRQFAIPSGRSVLFLSEKEIDWVEAYGKHVRLHCGEEVLMLRMSITRVEQLLGGGQFLRIQRSAIVNSDRIRWLQPSPDGRNHRVVLKNGTVLKVTRKEIIPALI